MPSFSAILKKLFGTKSDRDLKAIMPYVDKINDIYTRFDQLGNDELRAETERLKSLIRERIAESSKEKANLREKLRDTEIEVSEKEAIATAIDKLTKEIDQQIEEVLLRHSEVGTNYLITLTTTEAGDILTVEAELDELSSDNILILEELRRTITRELHDEILITPRLVFVQKGSLPQGEGKAVRVRDLRNA